MVCIPCLSYFNCIYMYMYTVSVSNLFQIFKKYTFLHLCVMIIVSSFFIVSNESSFGWLGVGGGGFVWMSFLLNQPLLDMQWNRNTFQWQHWNAHRKYFSRQVYEIHSGYMCQWKIVWNVHTGYFKNCQWQLHEMHGVSATWHTPICTHIHII